MSTFAADGISYQLLDHPYNSTADNERAVEVPLAAAFLAGVDGAVLEVGNVLSHYADAVTLPERTVVDLHERAVDEAGRAVVNADVTNWCPPVLYDRIVAISTVEHVGWDPPFDPPLSPQPFAAEAAVHRLRSWLAPGGRCLVTVPIGYHRPLDAALGALPGHSAVLLRYDRLSWRQAPADRWELADARRRRTFLEGFPYDRSIPSATAVWVGELYRPRVDPG